MPQDHLEGCPPAPTTLLAAITFHLPWAPPCPGPCHAPFCFKRGVPLCSELRLGWKPPYFWEACPAAGGTGHVLWGRECWGGLTPLVASCDWGALASTGPGCVRDMARSPGGQCSGEHPFEVTF